jgi:nitroreductase
MDLLDAIHQRRTTQDFAPGEVPDEVVDELLAAAHRAPNHKLTWPWRFAVVGPATRRALLPIAERHAAKKFGGELPEKARQKVHDTFLTPGLLIAVAQRVAADPERAREDYAAVSCAVQNLLLVATARGLGSKWGTGAVTRDAEASALLGFDPAEEPIVGFIWIGRSARVPEVQRPPLDGYVRRLP